MPFGLLSFDEKLQRLQAELPYFMGIIGGWPTRIRNAREQQEVSGRWEKAISGVQALLKQRQDSAEAKYVLAELLRMGHNMDVPGAAQASQRLLQELIHAYPNDFKAHYSLASLYVSVDPTAAPLAERLFLQAEALAAPKVISGLYQGLGFACLHQNRVSDAIAYFEKYLKLQNDPEILKLLNDLKSGKQVNSVYRDLSK